MNTWWCIASWKEQESLETKSWHNHWKLLIWSLMRKFCHFFHQNYIQKPGMYALQILRVSPIAQLVTHLNTVIKAFIIVCTKYDSSIFKILDANVKYVFTSSNFMLWLPCLIFHIPYMATGGADGWLFLFDVASDSIY